MEYLSDVAMSPNHQRCTASADANRVLPHCAILGEVLIQATKTIKTISLRISELLEIT